MLRNRGMLGFSQKLALLGCPAGTLYTWINHTYIFEGENKSPKWVK